MKDKLVMARNGRIHAYDIDYVWYHHMCLYGKLDSIRQAIDDGDFDTFMRYYHQYGNQFFPRTAYIHSGDKVIGEIDIDNPDGFAMITFNECECG